MQVKVLKGFGYPSSIDVRKRIRAGAIIPFHERGEMIEHNPGDIIDAPDDMFESWIERKLVAPIEVEDDA